MPIIALSNWKKEGDVMVVGSSAGGGMAAYMLALNGLNTNAQRRHERSLPHSTPDTLKSSMFPTSKTTNGESHSYSPIG